MKAKRLQPINSTLNTRDQLFDLRDLTGEVPAFRPQGTVNLSVLWVVEEALLLSLQIFTRALLEIEN